MQAARIAARAIGWLFVAVIGYHVVLAASDAVHAVGDGNWGRAVEMAAITIVGAALVFLVIANAIGSARR